MKIFIFFVNFTFYLSFTLNQKRHGCAWVRSNLAVTKETNEAQVSPFKPVLRQRSWGHILDKYVKNFEGTRMSHGATKQFYSDCSGSETQMNSYMLTCAHTRRLQHHPRLCVFHS